MKEAKVKSANLDLQIEEMMRLIAHEFVGDGREIQSVNLKVNARTGDIDLQIDDAASTKTESIVADNVAAAHSGNFGALHNAMRRIRVLASQKDWPEVRRIVEVAKRMNRAHVNLDYLNQVDRTLEELDYYLRVAIEKVSSPSGRSVQSWKERKDQAPQSLFLLEWSGKTFVGRKFLSRKWIENEISEMFCAEILPEMLFGELISFRVAQDDYRLHFKPMTSETKSKLFQWIVENDCRAELRFPFPYLTRQSSLEIVSPDTGWHVDQALRDQLFRGENHMRSICKSLLAKIGKSGDVLYDAACSTGDFLADVSKAVSDCRTIGQDLSAEMIAIAKTQLDEVIIGDAVDSTLTAESVDIAFIRFLNSEVVSTAYADTLLKNILDRVRIGGHIIAFGHTPILMDRGTLAAAGLEVLRSVAVDRRMSHLHLYPLYLCRKITP
jgi:isonocardicin synthase